eukprot:COSAG05_NODE_22817_length_262_cov_0.631902_2_plen_27_part_01
MAANFDELAANEDGTCKYDDTVQRKTG